MTGYPVCKALEPDFEGAGVLFPFSLFHFFPASSCFLSSYLLSLVVVVFGGYGFLVSTVLSSHYRL